MKTLRRSKKKLKKIPEDRTTSQDYALVELMLWKWPPDQNEYIYSMESPSNCNSSQKEKKLF